MVGCPIDATARMVNALLHARTLAQATVGVWDIVIVRVSFWKAAYYILLAALVHLVGTWLREN